MEKKYTITHDIIIATRNGDDEAFNKIYEHYYNQIYFFAYNHVNNKELAKDIVQNTFISVYKSISKLQHVEAFHVWIMRIAYCECKNVFRSQKSKQFEMPDYANIEMIVDGSPSTTEQIEDIMLYEIIYNSIRSMNYKLRDVASLRYLDGLTEEEISKILKIPKGTVKSRLHKIKDILQVTLKKNDITPATYKKSYSFTLPTIISATLLYMSTQNQVAIPSSQDTIQLAKEVGVSGGIAGLLVAKLVGGVTAVAIVVNAGIILQNQPTKIVANGTMMNVEIDLPTKPEDDCRIESIGYNQNYTREDIVLDVKLSNDNYDKILVNGVESLRINQNGTYNISVQKDGVAVTQRQIIINNIDRDNPIYLNYTNENEIYTIFLQEEGSGVDASRIQYYKNNILSHEFKYNAENQTIVFTYEDYTSNIFEVYDRVGNVVKVTVVSEMLQ